MQRSFLKFFVLSFLGAVSATALGIAPPQGVDGALQTRPGKTALLAPLKNWGLSNSQAKSHIAAPDAWTIEEGSRDVIVAVIDTGIDAGHKDLAVNIWSDPKLKDKTVYGWNFVTDKPNPHDEHGHGTHVAGIIGAVGDPKSGISGVAHKVSIMSVKYYSDANPGSVNLRNTVKAIEYAVSHGARIINYSGGGPEFSEDEYLAIKKAEAQGVLFVAAAGNEKQDTDLVENYYYPSAYRLSNIISVAATDIQNQLLKSSNWGKSKVDVAAPGENIFSTLPGGRYGYMSGTSQATAFVSGMAALLLARDPSLKPAQLREIIMSSVDRFPQLANKLATGGRVNAYKALLALRDRDRFQSPKGPGLVAQRPVSFLNLLVSPAAEAE
jgi:subtilisin family serine protease